MTTPALPLLLLAITFLFINTEMWQIASNLTVSRRACGWWSSLFAVLALGFLLVRLPRGGDRADDDGRRRGGLASCAPAGAPR